jgi:hypothetical protein
MTVKQIYLEDLAAFQRSLVIGYVLSDGSLRSTGTIQSEN